MADRCGGPRELGAPGRRAALRRELRELDPRESGARAEQLVAEARRSGVGEGRARALLRERGTVR